MTLGELRSKLYVNQIIEIWILGDKNIMYYGYNRDIKNYLNEKNVVRIYQTPTSLKVTII